MDIVEGLSDCSIDVQVTDNGQLVVGKHGGQKCLSVKLLPVGVEFVQPYPYDKLKFTPRIEEDLESDSPAQWLLTRNDDTIIVTRKVGGWKLWQQITVSDGSCVIQSFIDTNGANVPSTLELIELPTEPLPSDTKALFNSGGMGSFSIRKLNEFTEGDMAKTFIAIQGDKEAFLINSEIGSPYPLYTGFSGDAWHGMVKLPLTPPENPLCIGRIEIRIGESAQDMLVSFAERTGATPLKTSPKCWNSWDFYHLSVSHDKVIQNTKAIAADPVLRDEVECIVVDMGWETRFGEWEPDPNFPKGMKQLADEIKSYGFKAGLWFAPIIIDPECNTFLDDYRSVGANSYGYPDRTYECCGLFGYILDVTRPQGEAYLRDLFTKYREMGYTYYKLDFLRFMMFVHRYHDTSLTNVQVMQKALRIIREAVGEDSYILGCNLPFEVGPGYCDATRISDDVSIFWDTIKKNISNSCTSYFLNGNWWSNDPDFLVLRGKDTYSADEHIYRTWWFPRDDEFGGAKDVYDKLHSMDETISYDEAKTYASLVLVNGGARVIGDPVMYMNDRGLELIRKVFSSDAAPGYPIDIFGSDGLSKIWRQELSDRTRVGIFNWTDAALTVDLDKDIPGGLTSDSRMVDFWTGESIVPGDSIFELSPHACRVIEILHA